MFLLNYLREFERFCRTLRRQAQRKIVCRRFAPRSWKRVWVMIFPLCFGVISGCSAISSPQSVITQQQSPTPTEIVGPFHASTKTFDGDFTITLDITPNRVGSNMFIAHVIDNQTGKPATQVSVTLYTTMQDMSMGTDSIVLYADGNGQFSATGDNLDMGGHWAVGIIIQTTGHIAHKAGMSFVTLL
jgi:hypothetical protein